MSRTVEDIRAAFDAAETAFDLRPLMANADDFSPCPCFTIEADGFRAHGHCWRTYHYYADGHPCRHQYSGVHVWGDKALARRLKALLDAADWYGTWPLIVEGPRP